MRKPAARGAVACTRPVKYHTSRSRAIRNEAGDRAQEAAEDGGDVEPHRWGSRARAVRRPYRDQRYNNDVPSRLGWLIVRRWFPTALWPSWTSRQTPTNYSKR